MNIMASGPITSWQTDGETRETVKDFIFLGSKVTVDGDCSHEIKRRLHLGRKAMTNLDSIKKQRHYFANKGPSKLWFFPVVMYGYESWTIKKAECRRIDAFELWCWRRLLESPLDCKEIQPVHPKGNQSWIFIGRTDVEAETPILWPPDVKNWLNGKDPEAGKDWRWEEKGTTEDEMAGWHHQLNGHEFQQVPGVGDGYEAWRAAVHRVSKSWTWLSDWTEFLEISVLIALICWSKVLHPLPLGFFFFFLFLRQINSYMLKPP